MWARLRESSWTWFNVLSNLPLDRDRISHSISRMQIPFFCGVFAYYSGGCESHLEALDSAPCHAGVQASSSQLSMSQTQFNVALRALLPQPCHTSPVLVTQWPHLQPRLAASPWWNCNLTPVACILEFDGYCGTSCCLPLNVVSLQAGSLKKHCEKLWVLYLPDGTPFAVAFNIPEIPESYRFAV